MLLLKQGLQLCTDLLQMLGIELAFDVQRQNVIPGTHQVAAINGYWPGWCLRKDKAPIGAAYDTGQRRQIFGAGAQTMQHNYNASGIVRAVLQIG